VTNRMSRTRRYSVIGVLVIAALLGAQAGVGRIVRTHRVRSYLIARLEAAFGRPVQVAEFSFTIFPWPELDLEGVTIEEDPAFGHEYFLRAERMTASIAWTGLLRGHFEFGTMSLTRPSLILVRNAEGRWNLEGWLPPARSKASNEAPSLTPTSMPTLANASASVPATHHLQKLDFDDGRINVKLGDEKRPFAFIGVSGSVEQISAGRWRLSLEATPWRSGVQLQSTGTLRVQGDIAGTTARLQPAEIRVHWDKVSIADLFRLITGNDSGVRGEFTLDGNASVGVASPDTDGRTGEWHFVLMGRAKQIHRWDLTERGDNPSFNVNLQGYWNLVGGEARALEVRVELPHSDLNGAAQLQTMSPGTWSAQFKSISVQAEDLLAWYRAFTPGVADEVAVHDFLTGNLSASGWPLRWQEGILEGRAGTLIVPGLGGSRIEPFRASVRDGKFVVENFRVRLGAEVTSVRENSASKARVASVGGENVLEAALNHDSASRQGSLRVNLRLAEAARAFTLATALGRVLNRGWEYSGGTTGSMAWNWGGRAREPRRSGLLELSKAQLQVAGLNEPLKIEQAGLQWQDNGRLVTVGRVEAFGANWSGFADARSEGGATDEETWRVQLHADHIDAAQLDRWFGPRARPSWLERLLTSLLGRNENSSSAPASELLRRVSAAGIVSADTLTTEKIKLAQVRATIVMRDLQLQVRDMEAQWGGGRVRGGFQARFSPTPRYEVDAEVDRVNLSQLPWPARWAERWSGAASGQMHLTTGGVGREELLKQLAGSGTLKLSKVELRGWDVEGSAASGNVRAGASHWTTGEGPFEVGGRRFQFPDFELKNGAVRTHLSGSIGFDMAGDLTFSPAVTVGRGSKNTLSPRELRLRGPLEAPTVVLQALSAATEKPR
jgi:hypothetical protein